MWTATPGKHFFDVSNDLVDCGHMSGLLGGAYVRGMMKSDDREPYQRSELYALDNQQAVPGLRWRPCRSSRLVALAKVEPVKISPVNTPCGGERPPYAFANISVREHSPVFIIAQRIRASLFASATVTSRAGFFASSPTIQSRKALCAYPRR